MSKLETIKYQGKDYATVPARLKEFRETNPRASIRTEPRFTDDGNLVFQATIISDMADEHSAVSTGTAFYTATELAKPKAFEKLETISIGRALATLGYLNNGEVATSEEMREFEQARFEKYETEIDESETVEQLMDIFTRMKPDEKKAYTAKLAEKKKEILNAVTK